MSPLYTKALLESRRFAESDECGVLELPLCQIPSGEFDLMLWQPKMRSMGAFSETIAVDDFIEIVNASYSPKQGLYVKFLVKQRMEDTIRCTLVLGGVRSIRIQIGPAPIFHWRSNAFAKILLNFDSHVPQMQEAIDLEVLKDSRLIYYSRLTPEPETVGRAIWFLWLKAMGALRGSVAMSSRLRPRRVNAMRLLEESFRTRAE